VVVPFSTCPTFEYAQIYSVQFRELDGLPTCGHCITGGRKESGHTPPPGGHNRQELTHAAPKATEAAAPEATEAATAAASGIAGTPAASSFTCFKQRACLERGWLCRRPERAHRVPQGSTLAGF
jgi:hypothetical protein